MAATPRVTATVFRPGDGSPPVATLRLDGYPGLGTYYAHLSGTPAAQAIVEAYMWKRRPGGVLADWLEEHEAWLADECPVGLAAILTTLRNPQRA